MSKISFEKAMEQLEQIVQALENGDLKLEEALKKFEDGMKLSQQCAQKLEESERKINLLMKKTGGNIDTVPFEEDPADDA